MLLFRKDIALASASIMVVGDSISHLIGRYIGKIKIPLAKEKKLEGTMVAIVCASLAALLFVNFRIAFLAAFAAMIIEAYLPLKLTRYFDDNLIIPLVAGLTMLAFS
jgi:dolichol kinase